MSYLITCEVEVTGHSRPTSREHKASYLGSQDKKKISTYLLTSLF